MKKRIYRAIDKVYEELMNMPNDEFEANLEIHKRGEVADIVLKSGLLKSKHYRFDIDELVKYTIDIITNQNKAKNIHASFADEDKFVYVTGFDYTSSSESELQVQIA